ncbi:wax ester/triacylglycerol synthase family O-acyltransferase [soil metagenome]
MTSTLLSEEDVAILELEGPTVAGHTCKVIGLERTVSVEQVRARVERRIAAAPLLRTRLRDGDPPAWVKAPDFSVGRQVVPWSDEAIDEQELAAVVAALFEQRLDRERPLWRIDVVELEGGAGALIWRLHHALADGTTSMRLADALLWDEARERVAAAAPRARPARPAADQERRRGHLAGFLEREFAESIHRSPFDGEIGARRQIAFATAPLAPLHDAAKALASATVNDAVLCVVAGGLRRWVEHHHGKLGTMRFRVPVSLHSEGDDASNHDSFFTLPVHLDEPDPVVRLRSIHASGAERKGDRDADRRRRLLESLRSELPPLASLAERLEASPRSFALCVSNVPGPRGRVSVCEAPVRSLHSIAEVGRGHGLRAAVVSLAGELHFGLCADPAIADDLDEMAAGIEAEAAALVESAQPVR